MISIGGPQPVGPGFRKTVLLLLRSARRRAAGRSRRTQELLNQKSRKTTTNWGMLGGVFAFAFMAFLNGCGAVGMHYAVQAGQKFDAEQRGKIVVSSGFLIVEHLAEIRADSRQTLGPEGEPDADSAFQQEAAKIAHRDGGSAQQIEAMLRASFQALGTRDFVTEAQVAPGVTQENPLGPMASMLGSIFLLFWLCTLVFQGEGLEMDLQRRRHPMWEWMFSHPVHPGAVFLAEMLAPIAANPLYWAAPLFPGVVFGMLYGTRDGLLAVLLVGIPVAVAAACVGKSLEIGVMLRVSPRSRGGITGLMSWLGYVSMMALLLGLFIMDKISMRALHRVAFFDHLPWPWLHWFAGGFGRGYSFAAAVLTCLLTGSVALTGAVAFSVWSTQQGLSGAFAAQVTRPAGAPRSAPKFGREPLYRKELLWFVRDRSAIVQAILIPLTVAGLQLFNFRGLLRDAQEQWNYLCGAAIVFGTYFLWILGPKSLASEGTALWIALTWPRGLESLLKAKAWLWAMISTGLVALVLAYTLVLFPADWGKVLLVGMGWLLFSRSMAQKSVTLVTIASESGEVQPIPRGRRFAAQMGMLTFSIGVVTQQWNIAVVGIVYSYLTAAAVWQNFRARLPYLYDPWSEELPHPPTLMHAMVSISLLVEAAAVLTGILLAIMGRANAAIAQAASYGLGAIGVSFGVANFLSNRGVHAEEVLYWAEDSPGERRQLPAWLGSGPAERSFPLALLLGLCGGLALGLFAHGYTAILEHIPRTAEILRKGQEAASKFYGWRTAYAVMAVGFAPFAEEYLFRGLLFRALDREWGGWRAVVGSAAFFAIYHPPLSWLPVFLLGVANALLFRKTKRLAAAVVLHMVYNAIVLFG